MMVSTVSVTQMMMVIKTLLLMVLPPYLQK